MINGVMNIYKEPGYTSHDVVAKLRGILKQKKIGHMGTLDPEAVGVLPVCLGKATKLCSIIADKDKTYSATMLLGVETDTQDMTGKVINETNPDKVLELTEEHIIEVVKSYIGEYEQIPPMFSAIKVNGQRLYQMARKGEEVDLKPRHRTISDITITDINIPRVSFDVTCSKGTYIRTLCHDIGQKLGVKGCMESLTRTRVERFNVKDSITLEKVKEYFEEGVLDDYIIPADEMLNMYSKCIVSPETDKLVQNGNIFTSRGTMLRMNSEDGQTVRVYTHDGVFVGLYKYQSLRQIYKPLKIFL